MARADSTIRVNIIGDAKGLSKELGKADKGLSSFGKGIVGAIGIGIATDKAIEFLGDALNEADRLGDATTRLQLQVGDLADELVGAADGFAKMGLSTQDVLELEAAFGDTAKALQLSDANIVKFADDAAATAGAIALLTDMDADTVIDLIGKAAGGGAKALKALGISVTDAEIATRALATTGKTNADQLTASELAAASYSLVLEALKPRLDAIALGTGDVEQKQAELQARWETLTGKIGQGVEGPLNDLLAWIIAGWEGWEQFGAAMAAAQGTVEAMKAPVLELAAAIAQLLALLGRLHGFGVGIDVPGLAGSIPNFGGSNPFKGGGGDSGITLNVTPKDSADTERAVIAALRDYEQRNGRTVL